MSECFIHGVGGKSEGAYAWKKQRCLVNEYWQNVASPGSYVELYSSFNISPTGKLSPAGTRTANGIADRVGTTLNGYWFYNGEKQVRYYNGTNISNPDTSFGAPPVICYGTEVTTTVQTLAYIVSDDANAYPTPPDIVSSGEQFYTKI